MPDRRVVIVAPTEREALGEAEVLGVDRRHLTVVYNGVTDRLRGYAFTEDGLVRVREDGWSDELRTMVELSLGAGGELV